MPRSLKPILSKMGGLESDVDIEGGLGNFLRACGEGGAAVLLGL